MSRDGVRAPVAGERRAAVAAASTPPARRARLDRRDPVRRRASWPAQRDAHGPRRPDRRAVVPVAAIVGVRAPGGARPSPDGRAPPAPARRSTSATSSSRSSGRSSRPRPAAAARPATSAGRRRTSCACLSRTACCTSAASTTPRQPRKHRCGRSNGACCLLGRARPDSEGSPYPVIARSLTRSLPAAHRRCAPARAGCLRGARGPSAPRTTPPDRGAGPRIRDRSGSPSRSAPR